MRGKIIATSLVLVLTVGALVALSSGSNDAPTSGPSNPLETHGDNAPAPETLVDRSLRIGNSGALVPLRQMPPTTEELLIKVSWKDDVEDVYDFVQVEYRTAASNQWTNGGPIEPGVEKIIPVTDATVDRPEQSRSAWVLRLSTQHETGRAIGSFTADLAVIAQGNAERTFTVTASTPSTLLEVQHTANHAHYWHDDETLGGAQTGRTVAIHALPDGVLVNDKLTVHLELNAHPAVIGALDLGYKAPSGGFYWMAPTNSQGRFVTFEIPRVEADVATLGASQWEFALRTHESTGWQDGGAGYSFGDYTLQVIQ